MTTGTSRALARPRTMKHLFVIHSALNTNPSSTIIRSILALALFAAVPACTADVGAENATAGESALAGGSIAAEKQFPASVALITPLPEPDARTCITEDRRCTMTRVGPRAYLSAGHCFADSHE